MKPEAITAVCSALIALLALIISIVETRRSREENKISRLPMLKIRLSTEEGGFLSFGIENEGNGAAFIEEFKITADGNPIKFSQLFPKAFGVGSQFISKRFVHSLPDIVKANSYEEIFRISEIGDSPRSDKQLMHEFATKIGLSIKSRPLKSSDERQEINLSTIAAKNGEGIDDA